MKSVGLKPWHITSLVIRETILLVSLAALAGAGLGIPAVWAVNAAGGIDLSATVFDVRLFSVSSVIFPRLTAGAVLLPLLVTLASGLVASFLPARKAGRTSVVEALRKL